MKVTVITVTLNSELTIKDTIASVLAQKDVEIQHVIKDGLSDDKTLDMIIGQNPNVSQKIVSKADNGIYDAMNQGLEYANGDIICFLNSDDRFFDHLVLKDVVEIFKKTNADFVFGNINMINADGKVKRHWQNTKINSGVMFQQIPHPAFFVRKKILQNLTPAFDTSYIIAGDLKQQLIICHDVGLNGVQLNRVVVNMTLGGKSTFSYRAYCIGWIESARAFNQVFGHGGIIFVVLKVLAKVVQIRK